MGNRHQDSEHDRIMRRAEKVRSLRLAGLSWRQIAQQVDCGVDTVRKDWDRIQVEFPEQTTRELIAEQNEQIREMFMPFYLRAKKGDVKAADTALKLMKHRAELFRLFEVKQDNGQAAAGAALDSLMDAIMRAATPKEE